MRCVRSVSFSFLLNSSVYGGIRPYRGLRQGDPLSPFLFVICAQGFSSLLQVYERRGRISGVPIVHREVNITHLFFADDSLLFIKARKEEGEAIKEILKLYEKASGQFINLNKTSASFSPNTKREDIEEIKQSLGIEGERGIQMYLGLPAFSLRQKRIQFGYIKDKVQRKLLSWNQREFSAGGKEVLLKAIIQAIPTYAMQCFRILEAVCEDIDRLCAGFWWGDAEGGRRMHWKKWSSMCKPKEKGGMGFRDIRCFNRALLAKHVWRMISNPNFMVARVFKARYFKNCDIMEARVCSNASFVWRSLVWSRKIIKEGCVWRVGNGHEISIWEDKWVNGIEGSLVDYGEKVSVENSKVSELLESGRAWDENCLQRLFSSVIQERIKNTPIGERGDRDERMWRWDDKGRFSVKSGYLLEIGFYKRDPNVSSPDRKLWSRLVWNLSIPPKAKVFMWRALSNLIPTPANMRNHHVPTPGICALCGDRWGSTEHCLLYCPRVVKIWKNSRFKQVVKQANGLPLVEVAEAVRKEFELTEQAHASRREEGRANFRGGVHDPVGNVSASAVNSCCCK